MNAEERAFVKECVDGGIKRIETKLEGIEKLFDEKNNSLCVKVDDHEKRLRKVENKFTYYLGKVAGIGLVMGGIGSLVVIIIQVLVG